jgi:hypothetical protein
METVACVVKWHAVQEGMVPNVLHAIQDRCDTVMRGMIMVMMMIKEDHDGGGGW